MNDVFTCIKMQTVWHLMALLQFISFTIWDIKCLNTTFKINKRRSNQWGMKQMTFFQTTEALPLRKKKKKQHNRKRSSVTCFSCWLSLSVVRSLQMVLHSLQWRLMVFWPTGEECQLSPQLHTKAKRQSGLQGSKGSHDVTWSYTINGHRVLAFGNHALNGAEQLDKC